MDRRTWLQVLGLLSAARSAATQDRPPATPPPATNPSGGGRGQGSGQQQPMRITKEQVVAALALLGLEFQDAEIDMMLRRVNSSLYGYETLRKAEAPYGT